jgi:hypothetical protein
MEVGANTLAVCDGVAVGVNLISSFDASDVAYGTPKDERSRARHMTVSASARSCPLDITVELNRPPYDVRVYVLVKSGAALGDRDMMPRSAVIVVENSPERQSFDK